MSMSQRQQCVKKALEQVGMLAKHLLECEIVLGIQVAHATHHTHSIVSVQARVKNAGLWTCSKFFQLHSRSSVLRQPVKTPRTISRSGEHLSHRENLTIRSYLLAMSLIKVANSRISSPSGFRRWLIQLIPWATKRPALA